MPTAIPAHILELPFMKLSRHHGSNHSRYVAFLSCETFCVGLYIAGNNIVFGLCGNSGFRARSMGTLVF